MTARDFENKFYMIEGMVIILRCDLDADVGNYNFENAAPGVMTMSEFKEERLSSLKVPYVILDGQLEQPHGRVLLSAIRESYNKLMNVSCG